MDEAAGGDPKVAMGRHLPSASQLDRARQCPGSENLPQSQSSSKYAEVGRAIHTYLEQAATMGSAAALKNVPTDLRQRCEDLPMEQLPVGPNWAQEVKLAWSTLDTARELGRGSDRDYSAAEADEFVGTADIIGLTEDTAVVIDAKSGSRWLPPARESWQLKMLALAACRAYGKPRARIALLFLREGEESPSWSTHDLDEMDLDLIAADLRQLASRLTADAPIVEGDHCRYCPAIASCPPKLSLLRAACAEPEKTMMLVITPENAAAVYQRVKAVKAILGQAEQALVHYSFQTPIDLGGGRVYGPVERDKEELDAEKTKVVLTKLYGPDVALAALELSATKASIDRALKPIAPVRGFAKMRAAALEDIRAAGGITVKKTTTVTEHKP